MIVSILITLVIVGVLLWVVVIFSAVLYVIQALGLFHGLRI